jgi:GNAT superfamily N-acetyltransferase
MMYRLIDRLEDGHTEELTALYQNEWWSKGRTLADVQKMLKHSDLIFAVVESPSNRLVGFARVLTDRVYRATLFDMIVAPDRRGLDLGRLMMDAVTSHPDLAGIDSFELHCLPQLESFYAKWGFARNVSGTNTLRKRRTGYARATHAIGPEQ